MKIEQTDGTVSYLYKLNFPIKQKDQKQGRIKNRQIEEVFGFWGAKLVYMKEERERNGINYGLRQGYLK